MVGNEIQSLAIQGDSLSISGANTVKLNFPANLDNDPSNELQTISIKGDSLGISNGNTVKLNFPANLDNDPSNELQTISVKGDSLVISNGNAVKLNFPINLDNDTTNELQSIALINDTLVLSNGGGKVPLEAVKKFINNSSGGTGQNGTVSDMWFGKITSSKGYILFIDEDTIYWHSGNYVLKETFGRPIDTIFSVGHNKPNFLWMRKPLIYSSYGSYRVFHIDSGALKSKVNYNTTLGHLNGLSPVNIDAYGNLISLQKSSRCCDRAGSIRYYNFAKDKTYVLNNPSDGSKAYFRPENINDSMILISNRVWKSTRDTIVPTNITIPLGGNSTSGNYYAPKVMSGNKVIYIKDGTVNIFTIDTRKSKSILSSGSSTQLIGTSSGKFLILQSFALSAYANVSEYKWIDIENEYSTTFNENRSLGGAMGTDRSILTRIILNNGAAGGWPSVNYLKPQSGITLLPE